MTAHDFGPPVTAADADPVERWLRRARCCGAPQMCGARCMDDEESATEAAVVRRLDDAERERERARVERDEAREEYELVRDAVIDQFNPADSDDGEPGIMVRSVEYAARYIASLSCTCPPDAGPPEWESPPCGRCQALGRARDVRVDR